MPRSRSLPAPATAATTTTETAPSRSHAGRPPATARASAGSVVSLGTPGTSSERIPVPSPTARDVAASDAIRSTSASSVASASPVADTCAAGPITHAGSSSATARQIATLPPKLLPGASLAVGERITARRSPEPVRGRPVSIRCPTAMLRVVLPPIACTAASWQSRCAVA